MAYDSQIFAAASARLAQQRDRAAAENARRKELLYQKLPRLAEIENELARTGMKAVREVLAGGELRPRIEALRRENMELKAERAELLVSGGYPPDELEPRYACPKCRDTGYAGDTVCTCLQALLREEACKAANAGSPLPLFTFDSFDLSYYPDETLPKYGVNVRRNMERVFERCKRYAERFRRDEKSLLLLGQTGLGKTHLALAIAGTVLENGYGVIYDTAQNIFMRVEDEFYRHGERKYTFSLFDCDLLILDELPDYAGPFAVNTFYNILNTRMLHHRPMIVSTNLSEQELAARYGERIFSRLIGEFELLKFFGSDIRQLRLRRQGGV